MSRISQALHWPQHCAHRMCNTIKNNAYAFKANFTCENFKQLIREIFSAIAKIYVFLGLAMASIPFGLSSLINRCTRPSTTVIIGSEEEVLLEEELSEELQRLSRVMHKVTTLTFQQAEEQELIFNEAAIEALQILHPLKIICHQGISEELLLQLTTDTHFYKQAEDLSYSFVPKIVTLDLPATLQEAVQLVEELIEQGEQVIKIYYPSSIKPKKKGDLIAFHRNLLKLKPSLIMEKLYPKSAEELGRVHSLVNL